MQLTHPSLATPRADGAVAPPSSPRQRLIDDLPIHERRLDAAGIETALLEGGSGSPVLLLHGPGESAVNWRRVIPALAATHRVIAPDLPAHGQTAAPADPGSPEHVLAWLEALIAETCGAAPALVGHVLGGAIAARYAIEGRSELSHLILVDSLGLARFRPSARFAAGFLRFKARPSEETYLRFMRQCAYDLDELREAIGSRWEAFVAENLESARGPKAKPAAKLFRAVGIPRIPPAELARITTPTTLIWGRDDRALRVAIAERASESYGWPLHIIERSADDPARDRPEDFMRALQVALGRTVTRRRR